MARATYDHRYLHLSRQESLGVLAVTAGTRQPLFTTEAAALRGLVRRLARGMGDRAGLEEDLMQEALIHLWQKESLCPGQTVSWYLQSCWFHLLDKVREGRSVDALKHRHLGTPLEPEGLDAEDCPALPAVEESVRSAVIAQDLLAVLLLRLAPAQQRTLKLLVKGYDLSEAARAIGISRPAVSAHRRRIAAVAQELGITPRSLGAGTARP